MGVEEGVRSSQVLLFVAMEKKNGHGQIGNLAKEDTSFWVKLLKIDKNIWTWAVHASSSKMDNDLKFTLPAGNFDKLHGDQLDFTNSEPQPSKR